MTMLQTSNTSELQARDAFELQPEHLAGFRRSQALAYACASEVAASLTASTTEREAVGKMHDYLAAHGVREFFHTGFAWFGERTALDFATDEEFQPTDRALEPGMPFILDIAPVVEGYTSDIGYAHVLGENATHRQMLVDLHAYRGLILAGVRAKKTLREIYAEVDALIARQGYRNRHQRYGGRVLGHRVNFVPADARSEETVWGFGRPALSYLESRINLAKDAGERFSPLWNDLDDMNHPPEPGLWAIEPHLGLGSVGAKWEELLVVTERDAFWLDDDLPHVRRYHALIA